MAFSIKDEELDKKARYLASLTGESLTRAVAEAVNERIARLEQEAAAEKEERYRKVQEFLSHIPKALDDGYDHKTATDALWD